MANQFIGIPIDKIEMVVVGNKDFSSNKISNTVSVLDWVQRIYQLTGPVKKYTQNYMVEHILRKSRRDWNYFNIQTQQTFSFLSLLADEKKIQAVKTNSDEMINSNMAQTQRVIQKIVLDRFNHFPKRVAGEECVFETFDQKKDFTNDIKADKFASKVEL